MLSAPPFAFQHCLNGQTVTVLIELYPSLNLEGVFSKADVKVTGLELTCPSENLSSWDQCLLQASGGHDYLKERLPASSHLGESVQDKCCPGSNSRCNCWQRVRPCMLTDTTGGGSGKEEAESPITAPQTSAQHHNKKIPGMETVDSRHQPPMAP